MPGLTYLVKANRIPFLREAIGIDHEECPSVEIIPLRLIKCTKISIFP